MGTYFDHEKLDAYKKALEFASWCEPILQRIPKTAGVRDQLDRARNSIVLSIPEGNGRFTPADRCRFFDIARGSALESAGCLDLLRVADWISQPELDEGKRLLKSIVSLLVGLIRSNNSERVHQEPTAYGIGAGEEERE